MANLAKRATRSPLNPGRAVKVAKALRPAAANAKSKRDPITIFSFGYWGSGSATQELVEAVEAAEASRGFDAPLWVDVRISRSVQAKGFNEKSFATLLGDRYVWMDDLGNKRVKEKRQGVDIRNPEAARKLLDLALQMPNRRIIFFCACKYPAHCHRKHVGQLLLKYAKAQAASINVVEWPGGAPDVRELQASAINVRKIRNRTLKNLPVPDGMTLAEAALIPWGTIAKIGSGPDPVDVLIGPAHFNSSGAHIRVFPDEEGTKENSEVFRGKLGYDELRLDH